ATALIVYVLGFLVTPAPFPPAGLSSLTLHTRAANLSSLPRSLSAMSLALRQTDVLSRPDYAATAHHGRADETSAPIEFRAECATDPYPQQSALQSSRQAQPPEP